MQLTSTNILDNPTVPAYLLEFLKNQKPPQKIHAGYLAELGKNALDAKNLNIDLENAGVQTRLQQRPAKKLDFDEVAVIIMSVYEFRKIRLSKWSTDYLLGMYIDHGPRAGTYLTEKTELYSILELIAPKYTARNMDDVLDKIERIVPTVHTTEDSSLFIVNNGIYNQLTDQLLPFSSEYVYLMKIPVDYVSNPTNPVIIAEDGYQWDVDSWIGSLAVDDETNTLIWQVIADTLQPSVSRNRSIWFYSESGNNGKGTIGQLIKNVLGVGNYASLAVADFRHEFLKTSLIGISANIADENDVDMYIDSVRDYKASITGDDININRKHEKPITLQFKGTNIQMMNGLPKTRDKSDSFYRRIILVPFIKSFTGNGQRPEIRDVYIARKDVLEYVLWKALHIQFSEFIIPDRSQLLLEDYRTMNNPVLQFWEEMADQFVWDLLPTQFVYDLYLSWSNRNNPVGKPVSKRSFTDSLNVILQKSTEWDIKTGQDGQTRSVGKMDADEPLITEYELRGWTNKAYTGTNLVSLRAFTRSKAYRGYVRK